jgi:hypothetical protein
MRAKLFLLLPLAFVLIVAASACRGGGAPSSGTAGAAGGTSGGTGSIVVGLTSDLRVGVDIVRLHVVMQAGGATLKDEFLTTTSPTEKLVLPAEFPFDGLPDGTPVDVSFAAFGPADAQTPLVTRTASTHILAGKDLLLHLVLDSRCVPAPGSSAPTCTSPETCAAGVCVPEAVDPTKLPPYSPSWSQASSDPCKPANAGAPIVIVGQGQADYLPMMDGDTAQVEEGPQGGHHIWVALRDKNLAQSGSITSVTGHFPDLGIDVGPFNVIFTFEVDEGGYCKLYGLRFQLDENDPIDELLGHPLDVKVTVTDPTMDVGVGTRHVILSTTYTPL